MPRSAESTVARTSLTAITSSAGSRGLRCAETGNRHRDAIPVAVGSPTEKIPPSAERVARVVEAIPAIGAACDALRKAGWRATIAANRITVEDAVFVQFIGTSVDALGDAHARWMVYGIAGTAADGMRGSPRRHTAGVRGPVPDGHIPDSCQRTCRATDATWPQSLTARSCASNTCFNEEGHFGEE